MEELKEQKSQDLSPKIRVHAKDLTHPGALRQVALESLLKFSRISEKLPPIVSEVSNEKIVLKSMLENHGESFVYPHIWLQLNHFHLPNHIQVSLTSIL